MRRSGSHPFALVAGLAALAIAGTGVAQTPAPAAAPSPPGSVAVQASAAATQPARPTRYGYEIVATYPHDPTAFTQGLEFVDGVLIESTGRHPSTIRRVRLADGVVLDKRELDVSLFGEGLTVVGDRVLSLTWTGGHGFIWDLDDLEPQGRFSYTGEGWGLTHDATRVILSDGQPRLRFFDPQTMAETGSVPVTFRGQPLDRLNELEFVEGEVFANVWQTNYIVRIDPATGVVTGVIDLSGLLSTPVDNPSDDVLNGIAWDAEGRRLFVTGKNWPTLFEIRLIPQARPS